MVSLLGLFYVSIIFVRVGRGESMIYKLKFPLVQSWHELENFSSCIVFISNFLLFREEN